jgi:2-polyprenyl-3-methyl-5-hydroxy-6-metoxy-1,4-benzoquinol methylase
MINDLTFTGERVVPNRTCHAQTMAEHLIRYAFATKYAKVGRILDVACGTGYGLKVMGWLGAEKFGADIDKESVDFSKEFNQSDFFHTINFERQSLTAYFTVGKFELITSFETIEHLDDPNLFLQGIKDCLKDDGKFIYSIPLANPSKYHKVVYTFESAYELITKYFEHEELFIQEGIELVNYERVKGNLEGLNKRGIFIVGVCHKKK